MNRDYYFVIMAGGIGSRFWPLSRTEKPKQFLDILGTGKTLLQQTYSRLEHIFPKENVLVVTSEDYTDLVLKQLPMLGPEQVLSEPFRRNTAPCIAYANYKIAVNNPEAKILVAPSDHLITMETAFQDVVLKGLEFVEKNDTLLTLGIQPSRPETGYGYIQINGEKGPVDLNNSFRKVKTFTEKPDQDMANLFIESGDFYWNSGMFFWSLKGIQTAFEEHLPEVDNIFKAGLPLYNSDQEASFIRQAYSGCRNISIDYGIMEKASNVHVLCSDFGWSDLGTWGSLYERLDKDGANNSIKGKSVFVYETSNSLINVPDNKLVVIQGLDDYIVVEADGILLICRKADEQRIKQYVNDVKIEKGEEFI